MFELKKCKPEMLQLGLIRRMFLTNCTIRQPSHREKIGNNLEKQKLFNEDFGKNFHCVKGVKK